MTIEDGEFVPDTVDEIEDAMMETAKEYFGDDLNDDQYAVIRLFYRPIAEQFAEIQEEIGLVLAASQIDNAVGESLDLLTALIGVPRNEAQYATGEVTFSRSTAAGKDYPIPSGTVVQTDALEPIRFETTHVATISEGETEVTGVSVRAQEGGSQGNLGNNTLTVMPDRPNGIEEVTNPVETSGGLDRETDDELRQRARDELAEGNAATAASLISACRGVDGVRDVTIFINDTNTDNNYGNGLPSHSFELVVLTDSPETQAEVGQVILDTKAAGDYSVSGVNGTAISITGDLPNGQEWPVGYSEPNSVEIYVDANILTTDEYAGDDELRDSITNYIGGLLTNGDEANGLGVSEDVIYNTVLNKVMSINGVHDVTNLTVGTSSSPTGTSNISIDNSQVPTIESTSNYITISKEYY